VLDVHILHGTISLNANPIQPEESTMKRTLFACVALVCAVTAAQADQGNPKLKSIEAIRFGPNGLLLIGGGSDVVTVETGDTKESTWAKKDIANIDQVLAGKLGLTSKDIEIRRIAVNPASRKLYVAVRSLKGNQYAILTIDGDGKVDEFSLENVKYNKYPLEVGKQAVTKITDVVWAGGRIVAATQAGDTFGSRVFTIVPGAKDPFASFSTETYHVGHGKWETKAPIMALMPYEDGKKTNVVGSFTCTPIVKYSIDDTSPEVKVKGISVVELGTGNTPRSMFTYEKGGKKYILINVARNNPAKAKPLPDIPSVYWVAKVEFDLLKETANVNEKALWRYKGNSPSAAFEKAPVAKAFFGTYYMDRLNNESAVVIREDKKAMNLNVIALP
jgi:hypothetical protein